MMMRGLFMGRARDFDFIRVEGAQHGFSRLEHRSDDNAENEDDKRDEGFLHNQLNILSKNDVRAGICFAVGGGAIFPRKS